MFDRSISGHVLRAWSASSSLGTPGIGWDPATNEIIFSGNGVLWAADHADWDLAGDFMIELPGVKVNNASNLNILISHWRGASGHRNFMLQYNGTVGSGVMRFFGSLDGNTPTPIDGAFTPTADVAFDCAVNRNGSTVRLFAGASGGELSMVGSGTISGALNGSAHQMIIGGSGAETANAVNASGTSLLAGRLRGIPRITHHHRGGDDDGYGPLDFWAANKWPTS